MNKIVCSVHRNPQIPCLTHPENRLYAVSSLTKHHWWEERIITIFYTTSIRHLAQWNWTCEKSPDQTDIWYTTHHHPNPLAPRTNSSFSPLDNRKQSCDPWLHISRNHIACKVRHGLSTGWISEVLNIDLIMQKIHYSVSSNFTQKGINILQQEHILTQQWPVENTLWWCSAHTPQQIMSGPLHRLNFIWVQSACFLSASSKKRTL